MYSIREGVCGGFRVWNGSVIITPEMGMEDCQKWVENRNAESESYKEVTVRYASTCLGGSWFVSNGETIRQYRSLEQANQYASELIAGLKPSEPKVDYITAIFHTSYATPEEAETNTLCKLGGIIKRTTDGDNVTFEVVKHYD